MRFYQHPASCQIEPIDAVDRDNFSVEKKYKSIILEKPTILGVNSLDDSAVTIKMIIKTAPLKQWEVAREFRRRVKNEFDRLGVEIPFPHQTVYIRQDEDLTVGIKDSRKEH